VGSQKEDFKDELMVGGICLEEAGFMFGVMLSRFEITATTDEDSLLQALSTLMRERGFTMLGALAVNHEDGSLITLGDAATTQSAEFAGILRCLADQIELNLEEAAEDEAMAAPVSH
jgi:hypothetical protein